MTCCFFSSFKTLLTPTEAMGPRIGIINVLSDVLPLAVFQVITYGRFWVITEVRTGIPATLLCFVSLLRSAGPEVTVRAERIGKNPVLQPGATWSGTGL